MRRRRLLQTIPPSFIGMLAGCQVSPPTGDESAPSTTTGDSIQSQPPSQVEDVDLPVPKSEMRQAVPRDWITAIIDPSFASDWRSVDSGDSDSALPESDPIIGVEHDGRARAYPLRVLNRHEIVNDEFGGRIAVTYCVICGSAIVFKRQIGDGTPTRFGVSGILWRSDLVMYDTLTESLWSQILGTAIRGQLTGEQLELVPSTITTWNEWQQLHPETKVLLPPPQSATVPEYSHDFDYFDSLYNYGNETQLIGYDSQDGELRAKTLVIGIQADGIARAYPFPVISEQDVVNDTIGSLPVVVARSSEGSLVAYDRRVSGGTLIFEPAGETYITGGGSRWKRLTGKAIDGPFEGTQLDRANEQPPMFWIGWSKFHPATEVFGVSNQTD